VISIVVFVGCGSGSGTSASSPSTPTSVARAGTTTIPSNSDGPFAVGRRDETFVDASRPTAANGGSPAKPNRTLETIVEYPASGAVASTEKNGAAPASGRFPIVLFVHGFGAHADNPYLHYWAAAGFIAVAIKFPLTNTDTPGGPSQADVGNEPGDVKFVLSRMAQLPSRDADLQAIVDPTRVGLTGQSLGANVAFDIGFNSLYRDQRIKAVVAMSGACGACPAGLEAPGGKYYTAAPIPVMFVHGTADPFAPIEHSAQEYAKAPAPKFFLSLIGAEHVQYGPPWEPIAEHVTIDFFDRYVKNESDALTRLKTDAVVAGKARLESAT
jgi:predicted dienelactone hydrolase